MALPGQNQAAEHESERHGCQLSAGRLVDRILESLLPPQCPACDSPMPEAGGLCAQCQPALRPLGRQCEHCALPLPPHTSGICGACINNPQRLDHAHAGFEYNHTLRSMIHALKFHHKLALAPLLGDLLAQQFPAPSALSDFDVLIPAPLHIARLRQRGFNQAVELCRPIALHTRLPMRRDLLTRTRATSKQTRLDRTQRQANVRNAFAARADVDGLKVVLFDDVMTTGATLNAMARALRRAGACKVAAITLARVI